MVNALLNLLLFSDLVYDHYTGYLVLETTVLHDLLGRVAVVWGCIPGHICHLDHLLLFLSLHAIIISLVVILLILLEAILTRSIVSLLLDIAASTIVAADLTLFSWSRVDTVGDVDHSVV